MSHLPYPVLLTILALTGFMISGLPTFFLRDRPRIAHNISVAIALLSAIAGAAGLVSVFITGTVSAEFGWRILGERATVAIDALSAFFMVPIYLVGALGALYGRGYLPREQHGLKAATLSLFWGFTIAGMVLVLIARQSVLFLMGWELMALAAFFLITHEHEKSEVRSAGWIYLVATHAGTLALFALFGLLSRATGSFVLRPLLPTEASSIAPALFFILVLFGFGVKAGLMPLHFWLPAAHANAPSHVSALLSGVMLKMGVYGLVRFLGYMPMPPVFWGAVVLALGCISGVLGVVFAISQHDLKRLLAYHSIENIGIILMGLGLALLGNALNNPVWTILGMTGCLLHVWNHAIFKSLLFWSAGAAIQATGTRQIDRLGGVARAMPWTAAFFLVGAVAICGLPPLNGFVSEWLIYLGLVKSVLTHDVSANATVIAFGAPVLALIGALALACFVKVYGAVFLGTPRSPTCEARKEASWLMRLPMFVLALACAFIGLLPDTLVSVLEQAAGATGAVLPGTGITLVEQASLGTLSVVVIIFAVVTVCLSFLFAKRIRWATAPRAATWGCGYALPTARMQYTAASFAQFITHLYRSVLSPRRHQKKLESLFPPATDFELHQDEPILDRRLLPAASWLKALFQRARPLHQGLTHHYLLYIAITVVLLLLLSLPMRNIFQNFFAP